MTPKLFLKWRTYKGHKIELGGNNEQLLRAYFDAGAQCMSAALHHDTSAQTAALIALIRGFEGEIWNDWSGEQMTPGEAVEYVMGAQ